MLDIGGQLCTWMCMITIDFVKKRISNSKSCKASHKFSERTIYEMGT
jgi:hypothetical protein